MHFLYRTQLTAILMYKHFMYGPAKVVAAHSRCGINGLKKDYDTSSLDGLHTCIIHEHEYWARNGKVTLSGQKCGTQKDFAAYLNNMFNMDKSSSSYALIYNA